jgi:Domain of Unknown Function (DUF1080)
VHVLGKIRAVSTAIWLTWCGGAFAEDPQDIRLFNGRDFSGWTAVLEKEGKNADGHMGLGDVFHIREGGVIFVDGKDAPYGYLRSEREFTNFRLHVEWRWTEAYAKNNSGLYLRTAPGHGPNDGWPWTYEVENAHLEKFKVGDFVVIGYDIAAFKTDPARIDDWGETLNGFHGFVWKDAHRLRITDAEKPVGQWNAYDITVDGSAITVKLNGILVNEATGAAVVPGAIGLQVEGAPIEFRNIILTPV